VSPRFWRHRVSEILEAMVKIDSYVKGMEYNDFAKDAKTIDAVIRNFIVIGEAAHNVPEEVMKKHAAVPWRLMADMRNFAVHEYWAVELREVWKTIHDDLPPLFPLLRGILEES
jgi:uncharacterized protein with HEPN domain